MNTNSTMILGSSTVKKEDPIYYDTCRAGCAMVQATGEFFAALHDLKDLIDHERVTTNDVTTPVRTIVELYDRIVAPAHIIKSSYSFIQDQSHRFTLIAAAKSSTDAALSALTSLYSDWLPKIASSSITKCNQEFKQLKEELQALIVAGDIDFSEAIGRIDPTDASLISTANNTAATARLRLAFQQEYQEFESQRAAFQRERHEFEQQKQKLERERWSYQKIRDQREMTDANSMDKLRASYEEDRKRLGARIHELEMLRNRKKPTPIVRKGLIKLKSSEFLQIFEGTVQYYTDKYKGYSFEDVWRNMLLMAIPMGRVDWVHEEVLHKGLSWDQTKTLYMDTFPDPAYSYLGSDATIDTPRTPAPSTVTKVDMIPLTEARKKALMTKREQRVAHFAENLFSAQMVYQENIVKYNKKFVDACKLAKMDLSDEMLIRRYMKSLLPEYRLTLEKYIAKHKPVIRSMNDITTLAEKVANEKNRNGKRKNLTSLEHKHTKRLA
ncbi:MAG: hypothetical protein EXX96DRAFT_548089 [Benjaminiella poitrasii]|nr:MAG: hypothetical protein EXX96DRAFT_548089 [Benjaminiella poitrasii]